MPKNYQPGEFESRLYREWEEKGYFRAEVDSDKVPFTIVMPPPNVTGQLHMGHALNQTIQDALTRFKRMQGYSALWLPGTDHASIATEVKVVEAMKKEGLTKKDVGREGFLSRAWEWSEKYQSRITGQLRSLGVSCDWSRLAFTMDENCSRAVREVFVSLYEKGLIYRGDRIINWCPSCKTALSDAEVDYAEEQSHFWHLRYPLKDGSGALVVATTRPETMLGDTAVAVNPKDKRYARLVGKTLVLPLVGREIPVVADDYVDVAFGSGAVKITPAHDPNDFEVGLRHDLPVIRVMDDDGTMNEEAGKYCGLDRYEARRRIVADLEAEGALVKTEPHAHNVGHCYRCGCTVEPIVSKQWFVKMEPLAAPAVAAVKKKSIKFVPDRFQKVYFNWMENIRDWCISRQLWWGHRIPAFYCEDCGETIVSREDAEVCPKCGSRRLRQDEDVLDTWFSSALWPFSTLGYPEKTPDLAYFYPTDVLVTAYDIIFFWVARMIFSGIEHMNRVPFKDVLIHGIVRDAEGRKMSKSLGNGIDPLEIIEKYGADTLRFSLLNGVAPGGDTRFSPEKLDGCRNFMNKIWNASRFVLMNCEGAEVRPLAEVKKLTAADKWIISRFNATVRDVTVSMGKYELGLACSRLYDFVWSDFCDWYIELSKPALYGEDAARKSDALSVLVFVLNGIVRLLHPFVPFITEEIYRNLPLAEGSVMNAEFPRYNPRFAYKKDAETMEKVMAAIKAVRNIKAQVGAQAAKKVPLFVVTEDRKMFAANAAYIERLAGVTQLDFAASKSELEEKTVGWMSPFAELYVPLGSLVDVEKELARLAAERDRLAGEIARSEAKLQNRGFVDKAPKNLVEGEKAKLESSREMLRRTEEQIAEYSE